MFQGCATNRSNTLKIVLSLLLCVTMASAQTLIWSDEFNQPDGSLPDSAKWSFQVGGGGWGNNELEYYTNRLKNAHISNNDLVITALKENYTGPDGITRNYTSARLMTLYKFSQMYGRFEARIKIPYGQGLWPTFWMLGDNIDKVGWPACGEIDIMENIGKEPSTVHGTIHGPGYQRPGIGAAFTLANNQNFSANYHVFSIDWYPNSVKFYVDSKLYETRTPNDLPPRAKWVFDHPFYILLNVAVGGNWPGSPDATTIFPQTMLVDYVRVYH